MFHACFLPVALPPCLQQLDGLEVLPQAKGLASIGRALRRANGVEAWLRAELVVVVAVLVYWLFQRTLKAMRQQIGMSYWNHLLSSNAKKTTNRPTSSSMSVLARFRVAFDSDDESPIATVEAERAQAGKKNIIWSANSHFSWYMSNDCDDSSEYISAKSAGAPDFS